MIKRIADYGNKDSFVNKARRNRIKLFVSFVSSLPRPLNILDVGGSIQFWKKADFTDKDINYTIINPRMTSRIEDSFTVINGDGTNIHQFEGNQFDVVFSNSVIEHIYTFEKQQAMASEMQRVGKYHFVQTPNYFFPIEPHFFISWVSILTYEC